MTPFNRGLYFRHLILLVIISIAGEYSVSLSFNYYTDTVMVEPTLPTMSFRFVLFAFSDSRVDCVYADTSFFRT